MKNPLKTNIKHIVALSLLIALAISILLQFNSDKYINEFSKNNDIVYKDFQLSTKLDRIMLNLYFIDKEQEAYLLTGKKDFHKIYNSNEAAVRLDIKSIKDYLFKNGLAIEYYEFEQAANDKLTLEDSLINNYDTKGPKATMIELKNRNGLRMKVLLNITNNINLNRNAEIKKLIKEEKLQISSVQKFNFIGSLLTTLVALISILFLYNDIKQRDLFQKKLNEALLHSKKSLEVKERFMANMSHEIRTPMNAIIGFLNLMAKTNLNEKQKEYLNTTIQAGDNLLIIINDILDFSKIEAGMLRIEKVPFSLPELTHSVYSMFIENTQEKKIGFKISVDKNIPEMIVGDRTRLCQILINLIHNSIKFTTEGEISVTLKLIDSTEKDITLGFTVKDTGTGIPEDKLPKIFEEFNQGNISTTREFGGTGLGLTIVKSLVELQNGRMNVKSEFGKGSSFSFIIKYQKYLGKEHPIVIHPIAIHKIDYSTTKILLVEDNLMNQKLASTVLSDLGFESDIAENGQIAIEMLKNKNYDIVLLDLQMPVLDGYQTVQKIRNELHLTVPVIAMTAHVMTGEKEKCIQLGMNDFITKPFREEDLYLVISNHLKAGPSPSLSDKMEMSNEKNVCDLSYLHKISKGKKSFVLEMITIFLDQTAIDLKNIEEAISKNNFETVSAIAHKMKTSIQFIGLTDKIKNDLDAMENIPEGSKNMDFIKNKFSNVKTVCQLAEAELIEYKKTLE